MSKQLDAQIDSQLRLPFDGDYYRSPKRKFQETIVLVPFYGGRKNSMIRYVEFLTESGFDCVTFSLRKEQRKVDLKESYYSPNSGFGMKHLWADQVEKILNELPGPKILFGFSNPSASAIEAAARRGCSDISAIVCDSGPSGSLFQSMLQYFKQEEPIRFLPLRAAAAGAITLLWSTQFWKTFDEDLRRIPPRVPILSIRGWRDQLITPQQIDRVFEKHPHLDWQKLALPKASHLNGLKDFPDEYCRPVLQFLESVSNPI